MKINDFQIFLLHIPLKSAFSHSLATRHTSESVLLALADTDGTRGYGEGTPRGYVTGEDLTGTVRVLREVLPELRSEQIETVQDLDRLLDAFPALETAPSARCALELALLDLLGKNERRSVLDLLGVPLLDHVAYSAVISSETTEKVVQIARQAAQMRVRQVKLKVGTDGNLNRQNIRALREILSDRVEIRVDANAAWTLDEAVGHIGALVDEGVFYVEQPLPADDPDVWPVLQKRLPEAAQVYVDESVRTLNEARRLAERRCVAGFNLKVSKHGGILPSLEIHRIARENGLFCQLGCHVGETSLLSAAGRILAALTGDLRACEGSYGLLLLECDLSARPLQVGYLGLGSVAEIASRPGLGVTVDPDLLKPYMKPLPDSGEFLLSEEEY